jgi:NSS family neurotransmitter:Na+ symporter
MLVCIDVVISLLAYFVISPVFVVPDAFVSSSGSYQETLYFYLQAQLGNLFAFFFFLAAIIAAWTPTIAMAESAVVTMIERFDISRRLATCLLFVGSAIIGTIIVLSQNAYVQQLLHHWDISTFIRHLTYNLLIPISAFLTAIFAGWVLKQNTTATELGFNPIVYSIWRFLIKFVAPIVILMMIILLIFKFIS